MTTPILAVPEISQSQANKHITHNDALHKLEALVSRVLSRATAAQPGAPAEGDCYILPASPTGAQWATYAQNDIAHYYGGAWHKYTPAEGWPGLWVNDENVTVRFDGAAWVTAGGGTSLPVDDTTALVRDPVDNSKLVRIDAGAVQTGTTRTMTMPDQDVNLTPGSTFSAAGHSHAGVYEPVFSKNSAFNKNFGTTAGTVAEGNHTHAGGGSGSAGNAIINGACQVAQRTAPNVSGSYQYGQVDRFACAADGTPSAGTIAQVASTLGTSGYACQIAGLTTGAGGTAKARYRIESRDSERFINAAAIFSCNVNHDVGSAVDYTITINKANAADDFSAVTNIATGSATSVATGTDTQISLAVADMGDCTTGIEIIVSAACGAVTTKNFSTNEWQLEPGSTVSAFDFVPFVIDDLRCRRYYHRLKGTSIGDVFGVGLLNSSTIASGQTPFPTAMRIAPTALEQNGTAGDYRIVTASTSANCTSVPTFSAATVSGARTNFFGSGHTAGQAIFICAANANAYLAWSAEL